MFINPETFRPIETPVVSVAACLLIMVLLAFYPTVVMAHGGGLDGLGCHNNHKIGGYHCHRGQNTGRTFLSKEEALKEFAVNYGDRKEKLRTFSLNKYFTGKPFVTDGDTVKIDGHRIRLHGIDAPEMDQTCKNSKGSSYRCGWESKTALLKKVGLSQISCERKGIDRYKRIIAVCFLNNLDLNAWLVQEGLAVAYRRYSTDYVDHEIDAQNEKRGLWSGNFVKPENWRRGAR